MIEFSSERSNHLPTQSFISHVLSSLIFQNELGRPQMFFTFILKEHHLNIYN